MFFIYKYLNRFCYEIRVKMKKESGIMLWWIVFENICYIVIIYCYNG